jgi:hypothetical protein
MTDPRVRFDNSPPMNFIFVIAFFRSNDRLSL